MDALQKLIDRSVEHDAHKQDYKSITSALGFAPDMGLYAPVSNTDMVGPFTLTDWAMDQFCKKLAPAAFGQGTKRSLPREYLMALSPRLRATCFNEHLRAPVFKGRHWLLRTYDDKCRALLHGEYPCVQNTELLTSLHEVVKESEARLPDLKISRFSYHGPDEIHTKLIWKDDTRGGYGIGIYMGNSETGKGQVKVWPLLWGKTCENSIIFAPSRRISEFTDEEEGEEVWGVALNHRGSKQALMVAVKLALTTALRSTPALLDKMIAAEAKALPNLADVIGLLAKENQWTEEVKLQVAAGTEGQATFAGLLNGITFASHVLEGADAVAMELFAGHLLTDPDNLFVKAARLMQDESAMAVVRR